MSRKISLDLLRLEIPYLERTILVPALIINRHASRCTALSWPRSVVTNLSVRPTHTRTAASPAAEAIAWRKRRGGRFGAGGLLVKQWG